MKKIILGLAIVAMAAATSAFTTNTTLRTIDEGFVYGWDESAEMYRLIGENYDETKCIAGSQDCLVESPTDDQELISAQDAANLPRPVNHPDAQYDFSE